MRTADFTYRLEVADLDVTRGGALIAAGLTFTVAPGEAILLRGPNGSGKTSALRTIAGWAGETAEALTVLEAEQPIDLEGFRLTQIHWLGGEDGLTDRLTVTETARFFAGLLSHAKPSEADIEAVLGQVGLAGMASALVKQLSTGQRRRLGLTRLLLCPRALWLLDEPFNGLDAAGEALLQDVIAGHRAKGGLVLMATHTGTLPNARRLTLAVPAEAA